MILVFLTVVGFSFPAQPGADCAEVLHRLRAEHQMQVTTAETVGDTLVYLLTSASHKKSDQKTVQMGCRLVD